MAVSKKKKKKYLGLVALIIVCAALFAGYGILSKKNAAEDAEEETTAEELENLFDCVNTDILEVSYRVGEDSLTFIRSSSDNDWCDAEDEDLPIDQTAVSAVVTTTCAITVTQEITTSLDDAASFGLDDPAYEVTMTDDEGNTYTLYIGDTTGSSDQRRYAYVEGQTRIVSIANTIVTKLNVDLQSLLVVDAYPSFDSDEMTRIYYEDDTQTLELFNDPEDLTEAEAIGTTTWYYKEDGIYMPLNQSHSTTMLDTITGITFDACVTYSAADEELEAYGLLEPAAKLTIDYTETESNLVETETTNDSGSSYATETTTSDYSFTLNIGNKCEDEEFYYVSLNDGRVVYKTAAENVELFTETELSDYIIALYPALCNFNGIERVEVSYGDQTIDLSVTQSTEEDEDGTETTVYDCVLNGEACEESDARSLFSSLIKVTADHILADDEVNEDSSVLYSCTYYTSYEIKPEITIEISELNSTYYQLALNGRIKYAVTKQEFNTLVSNLEEYLK
jgi:hypothetical protein